MEQPDAKNHLIISLIKSALRIVGAGALMMVGSTLICGAFLIAAEILGILEELV